MNTMIEKFLSLRIWPLIVKELSQLKRNRRLVISLLIPPTVQIILAGFALNAKVSELRLGVLDESRSFESRELASSFGASRAFTIAGYYESAEKLSRAVSAGELDAALTIPSDFAKWRMRHQTADVQLMIDAVNSNTAAIASAYASQIIRSINEKNAERLQPRIPAETSVGPPRADSQQPPRTDSVVVITRPADTEGQREAPGLRSRILTQIALLFNPGLEHSWFVITGILGTIVVLNGSTVASASIIKEREVGTIEQLIMTPASAGEIIFAKVASLSILLLGQLSLALAIGRTVFDIPARGSMMLLLLGGILCLSVGISMGLTIAAITHNQQQAQLLGFFINPVIGLLSGALTPIEALPGWMQTASKLNPVRHFSILTRGVLIKGAGVAELYPHLLTLLGLTVVLLTISTLRLRSRIS